jgi:hypothetical protein
MECLSISVFIRTAADHSIPSSGIYGTSCECSGDLWITRYSVNTRCLTAPYTAKLWVMRSATSQNILHSQERGSVLSKQLSAFCFLPSSVRQTRPQTQRHAALRAVFSVMMAIPSASAVTQFVEALCHKPEGRRFESRRGIIVFPSNLFVPAACPEDPSARAPGIFREGGVGEDSLSPRDSPGFDLRSIIAPGWQHIATPALGSLHGKAVSEWRLSTGPWFPNWWGRGR